MGERELAQGRHERQVATSVTPAARGRGHAAEPTLCPSSTDWAPPAAVATRGQSGESRVREAALATRLTSTRNAMAGTSQSCFFLLSSLTRWPAIQ